MFSHSDWLTFSVCIEMTNNCTIKTFRTIGNFWKHISLLVAGVVKCKLIVLSPELLIFLQDPISQSLLFSAPFFFSYSIYLMCISDCTKSLSVAQKRLTKGHAISFCRQGSLFAAVFMTKLGFTYCS